ncbi:hypothetical protein AGMMS50267_14440 [Spirochaetia bacterium]|nr:hypothetical protein AGMMS50267_14440 [Spirochaetia bacterium]
MQSMMWRLSDKRRVLPCLLSPRSFGLRLTALITLIAALAFTGCAKTTDAPAADITAPAEIGGLTAVAGDTEVVFTWTDPKDKDFEYVEITFTPKKDDVDQPIEAYAGEETATITGLAKGTKYTFTIKTVDNIGNMSKGKKKTVTPGAASAGATAPVLSAGSVSDLSTATGTTATLKFTSGEAGTYYYMVLAASDPVPTAEDVRDADSGIHGTASALAAENAIAVTGLTAASTNTAYIVVEDAEGNLSAVLSINGVNPAVTGARDTTAPVLSAGSVSDLSTTAGTTATLTFTSGEAGTYYYLVLPAGGTTPTAAAVKAVNFGIHGTASALVAENIIAVTGLAAASTNTAYIVVEDAAGNLSAVLTISDVNPVIATVPDTTAPVLSMGSVSDLSTTTGTTVTLKFTSDKAGTYYHVVLAAGAPVPTAQEVKDASSGIHGTASALAVENTIFVTGLTASSLYTAYIVVEDSSGNLSTVLTISDVNPVIPGQVATPTATPEAGAYGGPQMVTLATTTEGADIYYTLDGTPPHGK